jgi:ribulose kinase
VLEATGRVVALPREPDSVLLGTAAVAATAAGLHGSLREAARVMAGPGREIAPAPQSRAHFVAQYRRFLLMQDQRRALNAEH